MSSYFSALVTTTSSKYSAWKALLPTNSDTDGDTQDDTHICRVLRAYYVEKGRTFPSWLPPDPKAPPPATVQFPQQNYSQVGAGYGNVANAGSTTSKLGSLWDSPPGQTAKGSSSGLTMKGGSARTGRGSSSAEVRDTKLQGAKDPYTRSPPSLVPEPPVQARPLPSQRVGSYQNATNSSTAAPTGNVGGTAQDRLKARLWGSARAASPSQGSGAVSPAPSGGGFSSPGRDTNSARDLYSSGSAGRDAGNYEDTFMPGGSYGGRMGGERGGEKPFVAATAPWASDESEFLGGGYGGGYGGGADEGRSGSGSARAGQSGRTGSGRGPGLPSGPRAMR